MRLINCCMARKLKMQKSEFIDVWNACEPRHPQVLAHALMECRDQSLPKDLVRVITQFYGKTEFVPHTQQNRDFYNLDRPTAQREWHMIRLSSSVDFQIEVAKYELVTLSAMKFNMRKRRFLQIDLDDYLYKLQLFHDYLTSPDCETFIRQHKQLFIYFCSSEALIFADTHNTVFGHRLSPSRQRGLSSPLFLQAPDLSPVRS